ncbi:MAG: tetratricopeptide repeat protein, partial [Chloroflexota bacterium]
AHDSDAAYSAFSEAIRSADGDYRLGDYYASRAQARYSERDLALADLLGTYNESTNAIRAAQTEAPEQKARLLAAAVPPQVIQQNFEGVLFAGRVASFRTLPEMRLPGPGHAAVQPWYALAELFAASDQPERALNVYAAILDTAPDETQAREALARLTEGES